MTLTKSAGITTQAIRSSERSELTGTTCRPPPPLLLSLAAEAVFGAVEKALDVRPVLHDDKHSDNHCKNHLSEVHAFKIVFRANVTENRKSSQKRAPENAANRNVLCRKREDYPECKCREHRERQNRKEHAKCSKHAFSATESGKARKAVSENHEKTSNERHPRAEIGTTGGNLSFTHFLCDKRSKKALQQIHENNRQRRFPAEHAERIREARILGAVVADVEIFTFREFCDPYGTGDRSQQVRYWKAQ